MMNLRQRKKPGCFRGFTLVEIIIVVVILGIAAMIAVPMFSGAADMQVQAAANRLAGDLDYAKGLAITYQTGYAVVFNTATESYDIRKSPYGSDDVVANPVRPSASYVVTLSTDSNFNQVNIASVDFDGETAITFDYLGSPYSGAALSSALNSGRITLQADTYTLYVDVEPMTGYVTITGP